MVPEETKKTFLCFDDGCIYVQKLSNIVLGVVTVVTGCYLIFKKRIQKIYDRDKL